MINPYRLALAFLHLGTKAEDRHDALSAGIAYKDGLAALGTLYRDPAAIDETGMKLVLAQSVESKEGLGKAAPIYRRVLESRIAVYAAREKLAQPTVQ